MALQHLTNSPTPKAKKEPVMEKDSSVYGPIETPDRTLDDVLPKEWDSVTPVTASADTGKHYRFIIVRYLTKNDVAGTKVEIQMDPFRIAQLYGITDHAQFSMLKKILALGNRGFKDAERDLDDIITAAQRKKQMIAEDDGGYLQFIKE